VRCPGIIKEALTSTLLGRASTKAMTKAIFSHNFINDLSKYRRYYPVRSIKLQVKAIPYQVNYMRQAKKFEKARQIKMVKKLKRDASDLISIIKRRMK